jgi:hypothetical protein
MRERSLRNARAVTQIFSHIQPAQPGPMGAVCGSGTGAGLVQMSTISRLQRGGTPKTAISFES